MNATISKCYLCDNCTKLYPFTDEGKRYANFCCTCVRCEKVQSPYSMIDHRCKKCNLQGEIDLRKSELSEMSWFNFWDKPFCKSSIEYMENELEKLNESNKS